MLQYPMKLTAPSKIKLQKHKRFLDLGSGDGKIALIASLFCKQAEGIEIDAFLHSKALEMQQKTGISNVIFHNKDFFEHKLELMTSFSCARCSSRKRNRKQASQGDERQASSSRTPF